MSETFWYEPFALSIFLLTFFLLFMPCLFSLPPFIQFLVLRQTQFIIPHVTFPSSSLTFYIFSYILLDFVESSPTFKSYFLSFHRYRYVPYQVTRNEIIIMLLIQKKTKSYFKVVIPLFMTEWDKNIMSFASMCVYVWYCQRYDTYVHIYKTS